MPFGFSLRKMLSRDSSRRGRPRETANTDERHRGRTQGELYMMRSWRTPTRSGNRENKRVRFGEEPPARSQRSPVRPFHAMPRTTQAPGEAHSLYPAFRPEARNNGHGNREVETVDIVDRVPGVERDIKPGVRMVAHQAGPPPRRQQGARVIERSPSPDGDAYELDNYPATHHTDAQQQRRLQPVIKERSPLYENDHQQNIHPATPHANSPQQRTLQSRIEQRDPAMYENDHGRTIPSVPPNASPWSSQIPNHENRHRSILNDPDEYRLDLSPAPARTHHVTSNAAATSSDEEYAHFLQLLEYGGGPDRRLSFTDIPDPTTRSNNIFREGHVNHQHRALNLDDETRQERRERVENVIRRAESSPTEAYSVGLLRRDDDNRGGMSVPSTESTAGVGLNVQEHHGGRIEGGARALQSDASGTGTFYTAREAPTVGGQGSSHPSERTNALDDVPRTRNPAPRAYVQPYVADPSEFTEEDTQCGSGSWFIGP